jgi:tRNA1Val (adenine37-N6)-methyltransferase
LKKTSTDSIILRDSGIVHITQPFKGHRFTLDSVLLADFCRMKPRARVLEPGAGTGVVSLLLAKRFPKARFVADEFDAHAYKLLVENIRRNGLDDTIVPIDTNIRYLNRSLSPNSFDVIVANPPYRQSGTGRQSPSPERQVARHDGAASLPCWLNLQSLLKHRGKYVLVFPADRAAELMGLLREKKLEPKRLRFVHPYLNKPALLVLLEAVKGAHAGLDVLSPLIVHAQDGGYTDELKAIYGMHKNGPADKRRNQD